MGTSTPQLNKKVPGDDNHWKLYTVEGTGLPAALSTLPTNPGHLILTSVPAKKSFRGAHSFASEKTAIMIRYGNRAIPIRPGVSSRVGAVATAPPLGPTLGVS